MCFQRSNSQTDMVLKMLKLSRDVVMSTPSMCGCQCNSLISSCPWWINRSWGGTWNRTVLIFFSIKTNYVVLCWIDILPEKGTFYLAVFMRFLYGFSCTPSTGPATTRWPDRERLTSAFIHYFLMFFNIKRPIYIDQLLKWTSKGTLDHQNSGESSPLFL